MCYPLIDFSKGFAFMWYLNCTMNPSMSTQNPQDMLPNGTYTSAIGFIQRNEIDVLTHLVRSDSVLNEPGIMEPELFEAEICAQIKGYALKTVKLTILCKHPYR